MDGDLLGMAEVAELIGVSRQRVHQLIRSEDFPQPVAVLTATSVWLRPDIIEWMRRTGRYPEG